MGQNKKHVPFQQKYGCIERMLPASSLVTIQWMAPIHPASLHLVLALLTALAGPAFAGATHGHAGGGNTKRDSGRGSLEGFTTVLASDATGQLRVATLRDTFAAFGDGASTGK